MSFTSPVTSPSVDLSSYRDQHFKVRFLHFEVVIIKFQLHLIIRYLCKIDVFPSVYFI